MYDVVIVGAGPAGITAAVYAARKKLKTLMITKDIGGQAALSWEIENYTGYQFITGPELAQKFEEHLKKFDLDLKEGEEITSIEKVNDYFKVKTSDKEYEAILEKGNKVWDSKLETLAANTKSDGNSILVFNPLSFTCDDIVDVSGVDSVRRIYDADGHEYPFQNIDVNRFRDIVIKTFI